MRIRYFDRCLRSNGWLYLRGCLYHRLAGLLTSIRWAGSLFDVCASADPWCSRPRVFVGSLARLHSQNGAYLAVLPAGVNVSCVLCSYRRGSLLSRDVLVDATGLLSLFDSPHFLPSGWVGVALRSMSIFAYYISRSETLRPLLLVVFRLVLLCVIAANLGCVILSSDITVIVVAEALLHSIGAVIELALVYLAILCHPRVDCGISHFWVYEFNDNRGCSFKSSFLG